MKMSEHMNDQQKQRLRDAVEFAKQTAKGREDLKVNGLPSTWDQGSYARIIDQQAARDALAKGKPQAEVLEHCGTAFCIAGYAVTQLPGYAVQIVADQYEQYGVRMDEKIGGRAVYDHEEAAMYALGIPWMNPNDDDLAAGNVYETMSDTEPERLEAALKLKGYLSEMFAGGNSIEYICDLASEILDENIDPYDVAEVTA